MKKSRREFIRKSALATAGIYAGAMGFSRKSYSNIIGANDRVRVGVVGFSDRFRGSLLPSFLNHYKEMNFDMVAVSDIWRLRREEAQGQLKEKLGHDIKTFRNNDELYSSKEVDAVIISTADFQHAMHGIEAVKAGCDAYIEKPFAETMEDNRAALKAIKESKKIVQIGSQRRSGTNYHSAANFIKEGKFGDITMVELTWNVNQPDRWRRVQAVAQMKEQDTDWKRFLLNRPVEPFNARKHLEFRLFWPYSSGLPGQWMSHQIDTVHWFSGLKHPRSAVANGGVYFWKDGRENWDTITAVFEYGPQDDPKKAFQVTFASRMHNGEDRPKEVYFSNGGTMDMNTNLVSPQGGLTERHAKAMNMEANLLPEINLKKIEEKVETAANTGGDVLTSNHMRNWMECVRSRKETNAPVDAGYSHAIAVIMANAAARTGTKVTFDEDRQEVMAGNKPFSI
ncbi:MAG TPA: Gfo/Idh/MocA family oxidoreductase [Cyclobacteriaceae bacterium]|nr:Gfo/Idh/MocA family oxidoreductase [Cyclobacteriaceae bacterium]